jgi:hypothetical protein
VKSRSIVTPTAFRPCAKQASLGCLRLQAAAVRARRWGIGLRRIAKGLNSWRTIAWTLMSAITGAIVWAIAALVGLQLAAEWSVIAFALNYIPFIGLFIATLLPTPFALAGRGRAQRHGDARVRLPVKVAIQSSMRYIV